MSPAFDASETPASVPAWKAALGWVLIAAACFIAVGIAAKAGDAYSGGRAIGRIFGAALLIALVAWAVTHKRSPDAKANARIVAGMLFLLTAFAFSGLGNGAREKEVAKKFLQDGLVLNKQHEKRFELLGERFSKSDLSDVLAPANATTSAGIAKSRAKVDHYRSLIAERGATLRGNLEEGKNLILNLPPGKVKDGAESVLEKQLKETASMFDDIDRAELAQLAFIEKILDWFAAQGNKLKHQDEQFVFSSEAQKAQFLAMADELQKIELEVGYASKSMERKIARAEGKRTENLKKANKILAD